MSPHDRAFHRECQEKSGGGFDPHSHLGTQTPPFSTYSSQGPGSINWKVGEGRNKEDSRGIWEASPESGIYHFPHFTGWDSITSHHLDKGWARNVSLARQLFISHLNLL